MSEHNNSEHDDDAAPSGGLSQFVSSILGQLSTSAWLPSAVFVASIFAAFEVRLANGNLNRAFANLDQLGVSALALMIIATLVLTIATQAFEFNIIRMFEGYWSTRFRAGRAFTTYRCNRHINRAKRALADLRATDGLAFIKASAVMVSKHNMPPSLLLRVAQRRQLEPAMYVRYAAEDEGETNWTNEQARQVQWQVHADPRLVRRSNYLIEFLRWYPTTPDEVLPTRLGNALRAGELRANATGGGRPEGWVIRHFDTLPSALRTEHDRFRSHLDLYCTLTLVWLAAAAASTALLFSQGWAYAGTIPLLGVALAWTSYSAGVSSAQQLAIVLEEIHARNVATISLQESESPTTFASS